MKLKKGKQIYYKSLLYQCINTLIHVTIVCLFLIFPVSVNAVNININNNPTSISSNIFTVDAIITGATNATNYLRVDLYKDGTSNYFGETYNGLDWYSGSDGKSYFPVQVQNSSASATLQIQLGNPSYTDYPGPGLYKLKIRRYTSSGSQSQNDVQIPLDIEITYQSPSPVPAPTEVPTNAPTTQPTQAPTISPTTKPTPTKTVTARPTIKPTPTESGQTEESTPAVLSLATSVSSSEPEKNLPAGRQGKSTILAIIFITLGTVFLGYGGYLLYNTKHEIH